MPVRLQSSRQDRLSVLALGAHSDDIEIGAGGTLMRLAAEYPGLQVNWVVLTATEARIQEARDSVARLLPKEVDVEVVLGGFQDSMLPAAYADLKTFLVGIRTRFSPDVVFTHCLDDAHQDHRTVAELTWQLWRDHLVLEYEIPKYEGDLGRPGFYVPLTRAQADRKVEHLMECFGSQRSKSWFAPDTFHALMSLRGIECRAPEGRAEAFHVRKVVL